MGRMTRRIDIGELFGIPVCVYGNIDEASLKARFDRDRQINVRFGEEGEDILHIKKKT